MGKKEEKLAQKVLKRYKKAAKDGEFSKEEVEFAKRVRDRVRSK